LNRIQGADAARKPVFLNQLFSRLQAEFPSLPRRG
jgi:hypothetical protein